MTELQKPLEDPTKPDGGFGERVRSGLRLGLDNPALPVVMLLMMTAFAVYLYVGPKTGKVETVKKTSPAAKEEPTVKKNATYKVREEAIEVIIRATGTVRARRTINLYAPSGGPVKTLPVAIGSKVTSATVIIEMETGALRKHVDRAKTADELAQTNLSEAKKSSEARAEDVKITQLTADLARADLEGAQAKLAGANVRAPRTGRLDALYVTPGQVVVSGQLLAEIVDPDDYVIESWVSDSDAFTLHIDDTASVSLASRPSEEYQAKVASIGLGSKEDEGRSGVPVRLRLAKGQETEWLRTGLRGARIEIPVVKQVVPVPRKAVSTEGDRHVVFVKVNERFTPRAVSIGLFDDEMIEVVEGLEGGEIVAVD